MLLLRFAQELEEYGKVEQMPKLEGKRMTLFMAPKPMKAKPKPKKEKPKEEKVQVNEGEKQD